MADINGNSFELGRLLGNLQAHMQHHGEALDRQNDILMDLPDKIADRLAPMMTVTQGSAKTPKRSALGLIAKTAMAAKEIMPPLKEIVWAIILIAASMGIIAPHNQNPHGLIAPTHTAE